MSSVPGWQWLRLRWPNEVTAEQLLSAFLSLNGYSTARRRDSYILLACGQAGQVTHWIRTPARRATGVRNQLEAAITGLAAEPIEVAPELAVDRSWRGWISSKDRPLDTRHPEATATGLFAALATAGTDEALVIRWVLGPVRRPTTMPRSTRWTRGISQADPVLGRWLDGVIGEERQPEPDERAAFLQKRGQAGWRACLHVGAAAQGRRRQRELLGRLAGAVRAAQGPSVQIGFRPARRSASTSTRIPVRRPLLVNVSEIRGLVGWPIGFTEGMPTGRVRSRLLPPSTLVSSTGRVVALTTYPSSERVYALSPTDALQHLHVLGPTGTGKSTLLLNLICQDMAAGRSVVVVEPRGDLIRDVLARVPDDRIDEVVLVDPTDEAPTGVNPLAADGLSPELKADHLLVVFKHLWAESWGPRTQDILTSGLLTLASTPGTTLVELPLLFSDAELRRRLWAKARDPLALDTFWRWYEALSEGERAVVLAPVMNKLRAFLLRKQLRRVIGQPRPRFDLRDLYRRRRILLVNLATGSLGSESAMLLGSLVISQLWQTTLGRSVVPPERRHPVMVYVDEFHHYVSLPTDLADVLTQARGLGVGLTLAHQHLAQLEPVVQAAVLANARSRVVFATGHDDANLLVRNQPFLTAADVAALGRYEAYVSLIAGSEATAYASCRTCPAPDPLRSADDVRRRSREQWGVPGRDIDKQLRSMVARSDDESQFVPRPDPGEDFGLARRSSDDTEVR